MTLRVLSLSHQAAAAYKGKGRSQPTCRARGCRDRLGIPKPPPPGGGHAPRGAPSTRAARLLGRTHRPRLPGARCPRATLCQRPPCVRRAAHHRAKRRVGVWCSLPMLGPCAQRQRYATACCAYRPTFIRCLSINPPPPPPPPPPSPPPACSLVFFGRCDEHGRDSSPHAGDCKRTPPPPPSLQYRHRQGTQGQRQVDAGLWTEKVGIAYN